MPLRELAPQPCMREPKIMPYNMHGPPEGLGGFLGRHAAEVPELNEFSEAGVFKRQGLDCSVQFQNFNGFCALVCCYLQTAYGFVLTEFMTLAAATLIG